MDAARASLLSFIELARCNPLSWAVGLACLLGGLQSALAETSARSAPPLDESATTAEQGSVDSTQRIADGIDGLPGLYRLGIPATPGPRGGAGVWLHYGFTEPQNGEADSHHRAGGTVAAGGALWRYLAAAVRVDFRHDMHGDDPMGSDSGSTLDVTPIVRTGLPISRRVHLGAEGRVLISGAAEGGGLAAPPFDGRLLASYLGPSGWTATAMGGFRLAQNGVIVSEAAMLRPGDRVVLGVSEFPAALMGLGVMKDFGSTSVLAEWSWDLLLGSGSPPAFESPLRLGLGARQLLLPGVALQGMLEVSPGGRAPSLPGDPLVPIEPRLLTVLGVSIRFPDVIGRRAPPPPPQEVARPPRSTQEKGKEEASEELSSPPEEESPPTSVLRVEVVDETGHPISDATVKVEVPAHSERPARTVAAPLKEVNVYVAEELPIGSVQVTVEAELLRSHSERIQITSHEPAKLEVTLQKASDVGSQLRGLVRSYTGEGIEASIRVQPGGYETTCNEKGEFVLDVPPGTYSVSIKAEGYVSQKRKLRVRKEGVTVLNADLRRER